MWDNQRVHAASSHCLSLPRDPIATSLCQAHGPRCSSPHLVSFFLLHTAHDGRGPGWGGGGCVRPGQQLWQPLVSPPSQPTPHMSLSLQPWWPSWLARPSQRRVKDLWNGPGGVAVVPSSCLARSTHLATARTIAAACSHYNLLPASPCIHHLFFSCRSCRKEIPLYIQLLGPPPGGVRPAERHTGKSETFWIPKRFFGGITLDRGIFPRTVTVNYRKYILRVGNGAAAAIRSQRP